MNLTINEILVRLNELVAKRGDIETNIVEIDFQNGTNDYKHPAPPKVIFTTDPEDHDS